MSFLKNGFATTISFGASSIATVKEVSVKPPAVDTGGPIDTTTMRNSSLRTSAPKSLKTLTEAKSTVAFDASILNTILSLVGVNQLITLKFPDTHTWAFYGYIDKFDINELKEGERPTAEMTLVCTNVNNSDVETAPAYA